MSGTVTIAAMGHLGDGVAHVAGKPVHVPFALPGEVVRPGEPAEILTRSPDRVTPVCRHFGTCGGCRLQHWAPDAVARWKRELVIAALEREGVAAEVGETVTVPVAARRRAAFALGRMGNETVFGFRERAGHRIVDVADCPVLAPRLAAALPDLRAALSPLAPPLSGKGRGRTASGAAGVTVLLTETGLDIAVTGARRDALTAKTIARFADDAVRLGWARLTVDGELVAQTQPPVLSIGPLRIVPPPGAFVQATVEAEAALWAVAQTGLAKAKRVADLFSGIGTFTARALPLAAVHAVEGEGEALAALEAAARGVPGVKPLTVERRDLVQRPLAGAELKKFDTVILDPPRAGPRRRRGRWPRARCAPLSRSPAIRSPSPATSAS